MGRELLPDELVLTLLDQWPCREPQLKQLNALVTAALPTPSTIVVHGPRASGKSGIVRAHLEATQRKYAIVRCRECVTARHLLERTVTAVHEGLRDNLINGNATAERFERCENMSVLVAHLQRLLAKERETFVLVFDGADRQKEAPPTFLPALSRLGEFVPKLQIILIVRHPSPHFLHRTGVPHITFSPYTRSQSIHILSREPPDIFIEPPPAVLEYDEDIHGEDKAWLWPRFCAAVWDSLAANAARDLSAFQELCHKLWRPFVSPVVRGDFGTRDFSRLLVAQRRLFQDENVLLHSMLPASTTTIQSKTHDLPYYAKWLLIAAYLASYNPAKQDALFFMKSSERRRRKKGGGTARPRGRPSQNRKVARHLLAPSAFTLDRLLSILHAILPHDFRSTIDIYTQIATLSNLRLLVRSGGIGSTDVLEPGGKWRVGPAVSWEYAQALARGLKFDLIDFVAE